MTIYNKAITNCDKRKNVFVRDFCLQMPGDDQCFLIYSVAQDKAKFYDKQKKNTKAVEPYLIETDCAHYKSAHVLPGL